jgi:hypothetical protein
VVAVDAQLGVEREVAAELQEERAEVGVHAGVGRPSARCPRMRVLFRRPPTRTGRAGFPRITALR